MSISRYIERFSIGEGYSEVIYAVELKKDGELSFYAKSRDPEALGFEDDSWDMPDFYLTYSTVGVARAPVAIMRRIGSIIETRNGPMLKLDSVPLKEGGWDGWAYLNDPKKTDEAPRGKKGSGVEDLEDLPF